MRIGLLTSAIGGHCPDPSDFFVARGVQELLSMHQLKWVSLLKPPDDSTLTELGSCDCLIAVGPKIVTSEGGIESAFSQDHFLTVGKPVFPLGLRLALNEQPCSDSCPDSTLLGFWKERANVLHASDGATSVFLRRQFGTESAAVTSCPSHFVRQTPLFGHAPLTVFSPEASRISHNLERKRVQELFRALRKRHRALFLAHEERDLQLGAVPGPSLLCCPQVPELYLRALISCQQIITTRLSSLLVALSHGVTGFAIGLDEGQSDEAGTLGLPVIRLQDDFDEDELAARLSAVRKSYPWREVTDRLKESRKALIDYLSAHGVDTGTQVTVASKRGGPKRTAKDRPTKIVATICDRAFLPSFFGLLENLRAISHEQFEFYVLVLDDACSDVLFKSSLPFKGHFTRPTDLFNVDELSIFSGLSSARQAYVAKPRILRHALRETGKPVLFLDLDLYFYECPGHLFERLQKGTILLFPHWNDSLMDLHRYGLFNAGMVGVAPGAEIFLKWWDELCLLSASGANDSSYYHEQGYLDLVSTYFTGVMIYPHGDENVAHWNLRTLGVSKCQKPEGSPILWNGAPVRSFHASQNDGLGLFELKVGFDLVSSLLSGYDELSGNSDFCEMLYRQQQRHWTDLSDLARGFRIIERRMHLTVGTLPERVMSLMMVGHGRGLVRAAGAGYRMLKRIKGYLADRRKSSLQSSNAWIRLQRSRLSSVKDCS